MTTPANTSPLESLPKISVIDFLALLGRDDWRVFTDFYRTGSQDEEEAEYDPETDTVNSFPIVKFFGRATKTSTLFDLEIADQHIASLSITYTEGFSYQQYQPDSLLTHKLHGMPIYAIWSIEGLLVLDGHGKVMDLYDLAHDCLALSHLSTIDYSRLRQTITETIEVDPVKVDSVISEEPIPVSFTLRNDNAPDVHFLGKHLSTVSSSKDTAHPQYSGHTGRWTELSLYQTTSGTWVCHQIGRTTWVKERDRYTACICKTEQEIIDFFGFGWLAKRLYQAANINASVHVD